MCRGFGGIATKDGRILFAEPNYLGDCSHTMILDRAGISDNEDQFMRSFVRVQFTKWSAETFEFDELNSLPGWVNSDEILEKATKLMERVLPIYKEFSTSIEKMIIERREKEQAAYLAYLKNSDDSKKEQALVEAKWKRYIRAIKKMRAENEKAGFLAKKNYVELLAEIPGYQSAPEGVKGVYYH